MRKHVRNFLKAGVLGAALLSAVSPAVWAADLPAPQTTGGIGIFDALAKRASAPGGDFPAGNLTPDEMSTILWAASGLNRGDKGWTVPMAMGLEPYCKIYVAEDAGIFLYNWQNNALDEISKENVRAKIGAQNFVKNAPHILIVVADGKGLAQFVEPDRSEFANVAAGAMTQDVYLAAAALGAGARYIHSMNADEIRAALRLEDEDRPICLMMLGK
jgi:nitroreductase